jgi:uncharacterized protein YggU (UPF0235/DUF167 family)
VTAWRREGADILLQVRLKPGAARDEAGGIWNDASGAKWLAASVRAVPERGRANGALVDMLARLLAIPKGSISLESGDTNRLKRLRITRADDALADRLTLLTTGEL